MVPVFLTVVAVVGVISLWVAARGPRDVRVRDVRSDRLVAQYVEGADYVDNDGAELPTGSSVTIADVERAAIQKGHLLATSDSEVVYTDHAPGLTFHVAYALLESDGRRELEFTTAVHYSSRVGRIYFFFVRPVHRLSLPWLTRWTARRATSARPPGES